MQMSQLSGEARRVLGELGKASQLLECMKGLLALRYSSEGGGGRALREGRAYVCLEGEDRQRLGALGEGVHGYGQQVWATCLPSGATRSSRGTSSTLQSRRPWRSLSRPTTPAGKRVQGRTSGPT